MKAVTHHRGRMAQLWIAVVPFLVAIGLLVLSFAPATTSEISQRIPRPHLSWSRGGIHARDSGTSCVPGTPPPVVSPPVTNSSSNYKLVQDCSGTNFFSSVTPCCVELRSILTELVPTQVLQLLHATRSYERSR